MPKFFVVIGLQIVACLLAWMQLLTGMRTDEAKYLLNIPYPHPPFIRSVLGWTDGFVYQEIFWRVIFATLIVQAVWIVWDIGKPFGRPSRIFLALAWLLSSGVILQAGSIYMASLTALQILLLLWLSERRGLTERWPIIVGILWLFTLFTAYQGVLLFPLVLILLLRSRCSWIERLAYFFLPLSLLCIYSLTNPLTFVSMVTHGSRDLSSGLVSRFLGTAEVWVLGGSFIVSVVGSLGLLFSRNYGAIGTFLLLCAYVALSRYDYYMILFTPLLIYGVYTMLRRFRQVEWSTCTFFFLLLLGTLIVFVQWQRVPFMQGDARSTMQFLSAKLSSESIVLIHGPFGHQWQYESPFTVRRYKDGLLSGAQAVVCLEECEKLKGIWKEEDVQGVKVYVRNR
ncbi:hypothetical protein A2635_00925 [Candidatus Peribacteria bacterium RIFCSPHIGHO2_01_FULL_51_9]|nr:MAG: hypothetical protein A2635_00925 [Candidatus Peribacteria bacterium RIFCSPHIGHO2_01_FULL_51_9]